MIQGGGMSYTYALRPILNPFVDFTKRNGTGGESIYGHPFEDENFDRDVDAEGYAATLLSCSSYSPPSAPQATRHGQPWTEH